MTQEHVKLIDELNIEWELRIVEEKEFGQAAVALKERQMRVQSTIAEAHLEKKHTDLLEDVKNKGLAAMDEMRRSHESTVEKLQTVTFI